LLVGFKLSYLKGANFTKIAVKLSGKYILRLFQRFILIKTIGILSILDGTVPKEEIYEMIRQSYMLTKTK